MQKTGLTNFSSFRVWSGLKKDITCGCYHYGALKNHFSVHQAIFTMVTTKQPTNQTKDDIDDDNANYGGGDGGGVLDDVGKKKVPTKWRICLAGGPSLNHLFSLFSIVLSLFSLFSFLLLFQKDPSGYDAGQVVHL